MSNKILLVGAGGHCKSVLDSLLNLNEYEEVAIIDRDCVCKTIMGVKVIGCDDDLEKLYNIGFENAFVTIGDIQLRIKLYNKLIDIGFNIPNIIDKTAIISKFSKMENGIFIGKGSIINANSQIGKCTIINTGAIIEHDCIVGNFVNIAPAVVVAGAVEIGNNSNIGLNTSIREGISIGENAVVGMGSVVTKDISKNILAYGNPCREVDKF